jgi:hypothetical protein
MILADHKIAEELLQSILLGNRFSALESPVATVWDFQFSGAHLNVGVPWRILDGEAIRLGSCDHEQKFGLPVPVNALKVVIEYLGGKMIERVLLAQITADLELGFEGGFVLNIFNHSSGYEGWNLSSDKGPQIIALGGGDIAIFRG